MPQETQQNQDRSFDEDREPVETRVFEPNEFEAPYEQPIERDGFIAPSDFVGGSGAANFANMIVAGKPAGWSVKLGHIAGFARSFERKEGTIKGNDGKLLETTWFKGAFRAMVYERVDPDSGEVLSTVKKAAPFLILPRSAAISLEEGLALAPEGGRAVIDAEVGLRATGKSIAYRYTIGDYAPDPVQQELERMQVRHLRRMQTAPRLEGARMKTITDKAAE
jgi:hypothetical protein